ncbi:MAG: ribonuclease E/G [Alphaproteobacteria bacterium]|jgi:Ribonuclease G/E|nr:ribonuclease E/G [Alphaproteobacteria bacterium]
MTGLVITCDRAKGLVRAAVWRGKELLDLYLDQMDKPDMTGAIVRGKIIRVMDGGAKGWVDAGLAEHLYLEKVGDLRTGAWVNAEVLTTLAQGKAWPARLAQETGDEVNCVAVLVSPPLPWQRALQPLKGQKNISVLFADCVDLALFEKEKAGMTAKLSREPVHPQLEDVIESLGDPVVPLAQGGSLVIEQTEALVAVDVNGGAAKNPTDVNLRAVRELARQIRLRNLSGLIVVDCLKMNERSDGAKLINAFARLAEDDPCRPRALGLTKAGLLEITRRRAGPSLFEMMHGDKK